MKTKVKIKMKSIVPFLLTAWLLWACNGMYDNVEQYTGEMVFPAKFDTIFGNIGYQRVEIDLVKAGRIPSSQIRMGKAKRTVIEYNNAANHDTVVIIDSVCSWVNIKKLTTPKMYRFKIYTLGDFDDKSVPVEISLMPFSEEDAQYLSVPDPKITAYPSMATVSWSEGWMTTFSQFISLNFTYTNKRQQECHGEAAGVVPSFHLLDLPINRTTPVNIDYRVIPLVNGKLILDTLPLSATLSITTPSGSNPFIPKEIQVLQANGLSQFTEAAAAALDKLTLPVHIRTMEDLQYFPHLRELDLTGGTLIPLPVTAYSGNSFSETVGGGSWTPAVRRIENNIAGLSLLYGLLNAGVLQKVYYAPNSMGIDEELAPFVAKGIVEPVEMPGEVIIPDQFLLKEPRIANTDWACDFVLNPGDAPAPPPGVTFAKTMKVTVQAANPVISFCLPVEYRWNLGEYRYLKFSVYTPPSATLTGGAEAYKKIKMLFANHLPTTQDRDRINSLYGQGDWSLPAITIPEAQLGSWYDVTVDITNTQTGTPSNTCVYNRIIMISIGGGEETSDPGDLVYYFADFRICK
ncbi:MAG: DUF4998 domain-containing protein [Bacteroidales bacterium]|jgi:hypothetical protein|nr:DUF4998 domain-containing protein [Bacteroidales bacterium]